VGGCVEETEGWGVENIPAAAPPSKVAGKVDVEGGKTLVVGVSGTLDATSMGGGVGARYACVVDSGILLLSGRGAADDAEDRTMVSGAGVGGFSVVWASAGVPPTLVGVEAREAGLRWVGTDSVGGVTETLLVVVVERVHPSIGGAEVEVGGVEEELLGT